MVNPAPFPEIVLLALVKLAGVELLMLAADRLVRLEPLPAKTLAVLVKLTTLLVIPITLGTVLVAAGVALVVGSARDQTPAQEGQPA